MSITAAEPEKVPGVAVEAILASFAGLFSRFHWVSLLAAVALAYLVWLWRARHDRHGAAPGFLAFLFPRRIWLHRSALLDYKFVLVDKIALGVLIGLGALLIGPGGGEAVADVGEDAIGNAAAADGEVVIAYTAALLVVTDLFRYWAHRLMHTVPVLWQFHKVHHSPEVLVPLSQLRTHPVNGLVNAARSLAAFALVTGAFVMIFPGELTAVSILGVNAGRFAFDMMGAHLRHSHVWLSWGPRLSRILISPAQHQIHHSKAHRHLNRNFGSQFALWDWIFGTLYVPERRERLSFGIDREETERMRSVKGLYVEPFRAARALLAWRVQRAG